MLERAKAAKLVPPVPMPSADAATEGSHFHNDDNDFEMSASDSATPTTPLVTPSPGSALLKASVNSRLITLANSLKASKKLPPKTIGDIDRYLNVHCERISVLHLTQDFDFIQASDLEGHLFLTFFMAAEARDHLDHMVKLSYWIFTEELKVSPFPASNSHLIYFS